MDSFTRGVGEARGRGGRGGGWLLVNILWRMESFLLMDGLGRVAQPKGWGVDGVARPEGCRVDGVAGRRGGRWLSHRDGGWIGWLAEGEGVAQSEGWMGWLGWKYYS